MAQQMQAAQISAAGGEFELVTRPVPEPGPGEVRIRVAACGICHSDALVQQGAFPGLSLPRVPGHEVVGAVDAVGDDVFAWEAGERVGVGWHGGHCLHCESCRRGDFVTCANQQICGISYDGGYAEYMIAPQEALVALPDTLDAVEAAPLLCAGLTTFNALRHCGARAGDLVAVQGLGGLGHLGVQFARAMGMRVVAISRGQDKAALAEKLGATAYIDATANSPAEALAAMGGARAILATAPSGEAISGLIDGLAVNGELLAIAATPEAIEVSPLQLIMQRRRIVGWPSGTPRDNEDTLGFAAQGGIAPMIERFPLAEVNVAFRRMLNNEVRFRAVLTLSQAA
ncbi:MAG: alcohol dehydrogenase [Pseudomonadota bacterium]|nr:alcohol dehydrogenase [Pseudomonadota bacterium]